MYQDNMRQGLYDPSLEHDNCGIGAVVNIKGLKSHETVSNALKIVENLEHRAGKDAEGKTGDGVGILVQISHKFFEKPVVLSAFLLARNVTMVLVCSLCHRMSYRETVLRRCLRLSLKKKA